MSDSIKIHDILSDSSGGGGNGSRLSLSTNGTPTIKHPAGGAPYVYLVETFYISTKKNTVFQVRLTNRGLILRKESNGTTKEQTIQLQDIIGSRCLRSKRKRAKGASCACTSLSGQNNLKVVEENSGEQDETDVSAYLYVYAYVLKKNRRGTGRRERTTITLRFRSFDKYEDNNREAQKWRATIKYLVADEIPKSPVYESNDDRKYLVLLNPKSGSGKSRETFQQRVAPLFVEAEIPYELHVTKRANFAREFMRMRNIYAFKKIIVVGGDGIYFEVINGLFERPDWERALDEVQIGIIPSGSGNGLAKTISHTYNEPYHPKPVLGATLAAIRGRIAPMDLVRVETSSQILFSSLSIGWGFISDIDIESERLRAIGGQRFTIWSIHRLISLRTYHGTVSYKPAENVPPSTLTINGGSSDINSQPNSISKLKHSMSYNTTLDCADCHGEGDCENCDTDFGDVLSLETISGVDSYRPRLDSWYSANSRKSAYYSTAESLYQSVAEQMSTNGSQFGDVSQKTQMYGPASTIPALTSPIPDTWTKITGEFIMVHAAYQTHLGSDCYFAPSSKLNDGIIWLMIIRGGVSRSVLLSFLLGLSTAAHLQVKSEYISMVPVTAFRIEPKGDQGCITVDGEKVEYGPIQGEIFPGIAKVMVPDFNSDNLQK